MFRIVLFIPLLSAAPVSGDIVSYQGNSFPEDVGWMRSEQVPGHLADRELQDGWLVQKPDVLSPCPPDCFTQDFYRRNLEEQAGAPAWYMSWTMESSGPLSIGAVAPASIVAGGQSGIRYHFTIGDDQLAFLRAPEIPLVVVDFEPGPHDFRLDLRNDLDQPTFEFRMDGQVIDAGIAVGPYPSDDSVVVFGARGAIEDNVTRWDHIEFSVVPEPATGLLLLAGGALTLLSRRRVRLRRVQPVYDSPQARRFRL